MIAIELPDTVELPIVNRARSAGEFRHGSDETGHAGDRARGAGPGAPRTGDGHPRGHPDGRLSRPRRLTMLRPIVDVAHSGKATPCGISRPRHRGDAETKVNLFDLTGKVAIVTGGNGGIGLGIARGWRGGASVAVLGRNTAKSENAALELSASRSKDTRGHRRCLARGRHRACC